MGGRHCCVKNCRRRSHDHHGRKIPNGLTFHCFPAWRRNEGGQISELTRRRRAAWVAAVGRSNITFNHIPSSMRVCSRHFHSGKPAYEMLESDPDWVPSLHMGHGDGRSRRGERLLLPEKSEKRKEKRKKKQRQTAETRPPDESKDPPGEPEAAGGGPSRSAVRPWRDIRSLLKSVLQRQTIINRPSRDKTQEQPAAEAAEKRTELSFRDFFRESLEASLEASSRSRALSARQPSSSSLSSSLSCLDCVRLQRTVVELREKLSLLTGEQEDTEASAVSNKTPVQPDEDVQSPETVHEDEEEPEWMEPLSSPQLLVPVGDEDVCSSDESAPVSPAGSQDSSSKCKSRQRPRFQKGWLKTFWFLRYSKEMDEMWCHVCRCYADKSHHNLALIKGSKMFKLQIIKKHSYSNYHKDSVERHLLRVCDLRL